MERGLTCIVLSCIYNLVAEIGVIYAKTVWDNLSEWCCAKSVSHFPGLETFFSAFFVRSVTTAMQMQRSFGAQLSYLENRLNSNFNH